jgi:hypothetical protein
MSETGKPWDRMEVEAAVADYLAMLRLERMGEPYNKSEHRRRLGKILANRSEGSIERKHQNISAIMRELNFPYIDGYKPLGNYQSMLGEVVLAQILEADDLLSILDQEVVEPAELPQVDEILRCWTDPPTPPEQARVDRGREVMLPARAAKVNYVEREIRNAALGRAGEEFVIRFEQARLIWAGHERLAAGVEHVSETRGDHMGFDILSFEDDGEERLIEVKTTAFGRHTRFFVTRNELEVSRREAKQYQLYRVFNFRNNPGLYGLPGALDRTCTLDCQVFAAEPSGRV